MKGRQIIWTKANRVHSSAILIENERSRFLNTSTRVSSTCILYLICFGVEEVKSFIKLKLKTAPLPPRPRHNNTTCCFFDSTCYRPAPSFHDRSSHHHHLSSSHHCCSTRSAPLPYHSSTTRSIDSTPSMGPRR